jgi:hypothetical protein
MKLPFETWLESAPPSSEAGSAFAEAIVAYKAGAYRAALLFSFVGLQLELRRRLLSAAKPEGIPDGRWKQLQKDLASDDAWDRVTVECTQSEEPKAFFVIDAHVRREIRYWRDRRNDCAHFKRGDVGAPHVEAFWMFLRSHLGQLVPNGSIQDVIERFARFFDRNVTPPGRSIAEVARLIPHAVPPGRIAEFLDSVDARFNVLGGSEFIESECLSILDSTLALSDARVEGEVIGWLERRESHLIALLRMNPSLTSRLCARHEVARSIWRTQLFSKGRKDLPVLAAFFRAGVVPAEEVQEAIAHVLPRLAASAPSDDDRATLSAVEFWDAFRKYAFDDERISVFQWANANAPLITWYLETLAISADLVSKVCKTFGAQHYPFSLRDSVQAMFGRCPDKLAEFSDHAAQLNTTLPAVLVPRATEDGNAAPNR